MTPTPESQDPLEDRLRAQARRQRVNPSSGLEARIRAAVAVAIPTERTDPASFRLRLTAGAFALAVAFLVAWEGASVQVTPPVAPTGAQVAAALAEAPRELAASWTSAVASWKQQDPANREILALQRDAETIGSAFTAEFSVTPQPGPSDSDATAAGEIGLESRSGNP